MSVIQKIKNLELSGNYPEIFLDPARNAGSLLILDGLNPNSIPNAITNGGHWLDLSGKGNNAEFVQSDKLSLDRGIRFADDNTTDYIKLDGLRSQLIGRTFAVSVLSRRTVQPGSAGGALIGNGVTAGSSFTIGYQPATSSRTDVYDSAGNLVFQEVQWAEAQTYGGITVLLGLYVQVTESGVKFEGWKLNDNFTSPIKDGELFRADVTGIFDGTREITIGSILDATGANFRGFIHRVVIEDLDLSGLTPTQFFAREWDDNRSRFVF